MLNLPKLSTKIGSELDDLPHYPPEIQGILRTVLQIRDSFLLAHKYLEEYRTYSDRHISISSKEFMIEKIQAGIDEITVLRAELLHAEERLNQKHAANEQLTNKMLEMGHGNLDISSSRRLMVVKKSHRKSLKDKKINLNIEINDTQNKIDKIANKLEALRLAIKSKTKNITDYYKDLFYLQIHFTVITTDICQQTLPLITDNISLVDRVFYWSYKPEVGFLKKAGSVSDHLNDIYTRVHNILRELIHDTNFMKINLFEQGEMEAHFFKITDIQRQQKDRLLHNLYEARQKLDYLEEENDRLVGYIIKMTDPNYAQIKSMGNTSITTEPKTSLNVYSGNLRSTSPVSTTKFGLSIKHTHQLSKEDVIKQINADLIKGNITAYISELSSSTEVKGAAIPDQKVVEIQKQDVQGKFQYNLLSNIVVSQPKRNESLIINPYPLKSTHSFDLKRRPSHEPGIVSNRSSASRQSRQSYRSEKQSVKQPKKSLTRNSSDRSSRSLTSISQKQGSHSPSIQSVVNFKKSKHKKK